MKEKKATKKPAREWVCETSGCKNPVKAPLGIQCPECMTLDIQGRFFCSQACFGSSWTLHKEVHKKARKEEEESKPRENLGVETEQEKEGLDVST